MLLTQRLKEFFDEDCVEDLEEVDITKDELADNIITNFNGYIFLYNGNGAETAEVKEKFLKKFRAWKKHHYAYFIQAFTALNSDYNPIENYDKYSEITDDFTGKNVSSNSGNSKTEGSGNGTSTDNYYGDNSGNRNPQSGTDTSETSSTETNTSGNSTSDDTNKNIRVEHTHGNIGVTTAAQMIDSELKLRNNIDILYLISKSIVDTLCYYVTED